MDDLGKVIEDLKYHREQCRKAHEYVISLQGNLLAGADEDDEPTYYISIAVDLFDGMIDLAKRELEEKKKEKIATYVKAIKDVISMFEEIKNESKNLTLEELKKEFEENKK